MHHSGLFLLRKEMVNVKFQHAAVLGCALLLLSLSATAKADAIDDWLSSLLGQPGVGADRVLEYQLQAAGFKYHEDKDGDFYLRFEDLKSGQLNLVVVDSHPKQLMYEKIRTMWIRVTPANKRVTGEQGLDVLRRNAQYKIGAWQVVCRPGTEECYPVFQIELPSESSTAYLKMAVLTCSLAAKDVDNDWTPKGWMADESAARKEQLRLAEEKEAQRKEAARLKFEAAQAKKNEQDARIALLRKEAEEAFAAAEQKKQSDNTAAELLQKQAEAELEECHKRKQAQDAEVERQKKQAEDDFAAAQQKKQTADNEAAELEKTAGEEFVQAAQMKQAEDREAHLELQVQRAAAQVAANQFNKKMEL